MCLVLWLIFITTSIASAEISITAKGSFDGKYKSYQYTPILIEVDNPSTKAIKGKLVLSSEITELYEQITRINSPYILQVHIPANGKSRYWFYLPFVEYRNPKIDLLVNDKIVASTPLCVTSLNWEQELVLGIVNEEFISVLLKKDYVMGKTPLEKLIFVFPTPSALPDEWIGYNGVWAVLIDNASLKLLTLKQKEALEIWSALGGKLLNIEGMDTDKIDDWLRNELIKPISFSFIRTISQHGTVDIGINLLSKIPQMHIPSPGIIFLLLFIYIMVIGPINYIVLKKMRKSELSWVTIPILVILFSIAFYIYAQVSKGEGVILNEISTLHIPAGKNWALANSCFGLFSPEKTNYKLIFKTKKFISFSDYTPYEEVGYKIVHTNNETRLEDLLIEKWTMRTFITHSILYLDGTINCLKNNHKLYVENTSNYHLSNSGILINGEYRSLGDIKSRTKQTWEIDKLKKETEYQAKELITKMGILNKQNCLLAWIEKPIIEVKLSPERHERKSTTLVIVPITSKEYNR